MKKILILVALCALSLGLVACDSRPVLKVYMPTEYISEDLINAFNKSNTDYRVDIITFDSNEDMLGKVTSSKYDLIIPSDYALEELVEKDYLAEIDWSKLSSVNKQSFDADFLEAVNSLKSSEKSFDLLKYGVPYFWGSVGLLYDTTKVDAQEIESQGWNILTSNRKVMIYDSARDAMMIALKQFYLENDRVDASVNTATSDDLKAAENWWTALKGSNTFFKTDEIFDDMLAPTQYDAAVAYSGDALYMIEKNPNLDYVVPHQAGSNIFIDAFVIPKNAEHVDFAYDFINFMSDVENAYQNSVDSAYTSPIGAVVDKVIAAEDYPENVYRVVFGEKDELFRYNKTIGDAVVAAWLRVLAK